ncbi:MAG: S1 RNA-binding domain-containing protein [Nanoarchaeota archaeon]|nr:S1 RNA-binding domain-containing protein [Nanoarchaeota archaeon]
MLYTKDGYPEINEIVKCTVKKIYGNTTFLYLDEYEKEGVLTISEIAPGRIRNLREHVTENKTIICKVLRVDDKQNRIDVSLRRVPIPVMKDKLEELKKEEYAERIYIDVAKIMGISKDELFEKTYEPIFEDYSTVFEALYTIMLDNSKIDMFKKIDKKTKDTFLKIIDERIKPEEICLKRKFHLSTFDIQGVDLVKNSINSSLLSLNYDKISIIYLAAGEFEIKITHDNIKSANILYDNFTKNLEIISKEKNLEFIFSN